jgi:eukaryotic-like serine/threonine-protein kinase
MDESRLGKYEIRGTLGRGAMGTVYEGWDPIIHRKVAIKTVRLPDAADEEAQEELARFKREAQAAGRLSHANIVGVFDYGETADIAYIVMEFIDGTSLKAVMDKQERFPIAETLRVMEQLLAGLQFSHDRGVVHRDIKPANIMLTSGGQVKIADFGIARIESSSMTQAGTVMGTPAYMSPEQFMGQTVDARTDLYSAGVLLYQLLTGERPFEGSMSAIMHKALNVEPPRPSDLSVTAPRALDAVVAKAMGKRPEQRFSSADEMARALRMAVEHPEAALDGDAADDAEATMVRPQRAPAAAQPAASSQPPPAAAPAPTTSGSRLPLIAGGAIAGLAVLGGVGWFVLTPGHPPDQRPAQVAAMTAPATQPDPSPASSPASPPSAAIPAPAAAPVPTSPEPMPAPSLQPVPPASPTPQITRASLLAALAPVGCTLASADVQDASHIVLDGIAGSGAPETALRRAANDAAGGLNVSWGVRSFSGPYCDALNVIRPAGAGRFGMVLKGNVVRLRKNDNIVMQFTMPDFPAYLQIDYFASDGSLTHLVADDGARVSIMTSSGWKVMGPSRSYRAGTTVSVGEPNTKSQDGSWQVDEPFGTDMILAIASEAPLFTAPRSTDETAAVYLAALQAALDSAQSHGKRVASQALIVETTPK